MTTLEITELNIKFVHRKLPSSMRMLNKLYFNIVNNLYCFQNFQILCTVNAYCTNCIKNNLRLSNLVPCLILIVTLFLILRLNQNIHEDVLHPLVGRLAHYSKDRVYLDMDTKLFV